MDARLPRPGWRGEDLGLPTGQGALTALWTGEGGERRGRRGKEMVGGEEAEFFSIK